jgi:cellobiose transport system permease protein
MRNNTRFVIGTVAMFAISLFALMPFYIMIIMGTHVNEALFVKIQLLPGTYLWENLNTVFENVMFVRVYINSLLVSVVSTFLSVLVSAMAGYAIAKYHFRFKGIIFASILLTMMIPYHLGLIAYIIEMRYLGVANTLWPLIFPWIASAFGVYWMAQFMKSGVPNEVMESARIDGCSELGVFLRIAVQFSWPAITTLSLLIFLWSWNNYLLPLIIINKTDLFTIPLYISTLGSQYRTDLAAQTLGLTLGTLPVIILFAIGSKSFIRGLTAGSLKG